MSVLPPSVIESFVHVLVVNYTTIAAVTVLIWDYLITLPDEVAFVWPSSWNTSKFLFLLNRYLAFVDPIMLIHVLMFEDDAKVCTYHFRVIAYLCIVGLTVGQFILILRAYAVWGGHFDKLFTSIIGATLCVFAFSLWTVAKNVGGVYSTGVPTLGMRGCTLFFKNRLAWIDFVLFLAVESTSTVIMVVRAIQHFRISRNSLMTTIYHDGLLYFACALATTIANVIVFVIAPTEIIGLLIVVQRIMHSVLCSRVILHIRSAYEAQKQHLIGDSLPPLVVAQIVVPVNDSLWSGDQSVFDTERNNRHFN